MTLETLWNETEQSQPGKTALVAGDARLTYRQAGEKVRRLAAGLASRWNVRPGEVVALLAPNCAEFVVCYFGIVRLGAIVQPIDGRLAPEEIRTVLLDSGAHILIVHRALWSKYEKIRAQVPSVARVLGIGVDSDGTERFDAWIASAPELRREAAVSPGDVAELLYTSGTTGEPKGVLRSHTNVRAASRNSIRGFGYRSDDVIAITMPLSHSSALVSQMMPLIELGGTLVLMDRFDVDGLLNLIQTERVTCMRAVPSMLRTLLVSPRFCSEALPSLRLLINSSAAIDPPTYMAVKTRFAAIEVMNSYGLTEASTCTVLPDAVALSRSDSVGIAIDGVEMQIANEHERVVDDEVEGEIWVRGEHVFVGYRNRPEETQAILVDRWLKTGDLGHRDKAGYYYLHGRKDDLITCGGRKVAPVEVENCILQLPDVSEVAVVGHPHRILGEVAKALVVPREYVSPDPRRIINHCARHLASHEVPFFVEFVAELPKNSAGKILRRKLWKLGRPASCS